MAKYEVTYTLTRTACVDEIIEADSMEEAELIARNHMDGYNTGKDCDHINDFILDLDHWCGWDTEVSDVQVDE